ncbi:DUF2992 family protein, partial [Streptosporangium fragile]|uniref:DUF2992 family protein n=1 Tax=Streptosporangium fragile TaxID=46186 RepID=UPI003CD0BDD1
MRGGGEAVDERDRRSLRWAVLADEERTASHRKAAPALNPRVKSGHHRLPSFDPTGHDGRLYPSRPIGYSFFIVILGGDVRDHARTLSSESRQTRSRRGGTPRPTAAGDRAFIKPRSRRSRRRRILIYRVDTHEIAVPVGSPGTRRSVGRRSCIRLGAEPTDSELYEFLMRYGVALLERATAAPAVSVGARRELRANPKRAAHAASRVARRSTTSQEAMRLELESRKQEATADRKAREWARVEHGREVAHSKRAERRRDRWPLIPPCSPRGSGNNRRRAVIVYRVAGVPSVPGLTFRPHGRPFGWSRVAPFAARRPAHRYA